MHDIDADDVARFWREARRTLGHGAPADPPPAWSFADTPRLADELLGHVLSGRKTATSTSVVEFELDGEPIPQPGDLSILLDGEGRPRAVIRTVSVERVRFADVDEDFAAAEGEDDLSLAAWREGHERYFTRVHAALGRELASIEDLELVLERFELVHEGAADTAE